MEKLQPLCPWNEGRLFPGDQTLEVAFPRLCSPPLLCFAMETRVEWARTNVHISSFLS